MHIKIIRNIDNNENGEYKREPWELNNDFYKTNNSQEEIIIPIQYVSLSKITIENNKNIRNKEIYQAHICPSINRTIIISKEEYKRIEHLLAFNNKKELEELEIISVPKINIKNAIQSLQVNEED